MISASGIRGIVYTDLNPEMCCGLASAFASVLGAGRYIVGRDSRPSGAVLAPAVKAGLRATGSDALDVGICPTPTIQMAVEHHSARGGIAVTASHNPAEWNALKLISGQGTFLTKPDVERVVRVFRSGRAAYVRYDGSGSITEVTGMRDFHLSGVTGLEYVDAEGLRERRFKAAVDCTNGAGSEFALDLLHRLGCVISDLDCTPDGRFRRNPEPLAENIVDLCELVRASGSDVGFALDPDGDRLAVVDEHGLAVGEDYTLVICADLVLRECRGPLVTNLSSTMALDDVARRHGVRMFRTPVGEINVVERMKEVGSTVGGEGNGGVILPALHYGRDALVAMALILTAMLKAGKPVSEMMKEFPKYAIFKEKLAFDRELDGEILRRKLEDEFPEGQFNLDDGVRIDLGDKWVHVRKSGTEPVVRLIGEAKDTGAAGDLAGRVLKVLTR